VDEPDEFHQDRKENGVTEFHLRFKQLQEAFEWADAMKIHGATEVVHLKRISAAKILS
jgi:hypothetical protein